MSPRGGKRPGAGRPRTGRKVRTMSFTANEDERKAIEKHARKHSVSVSMVIRSAVRWFFGFETDDEADV